MSRSFFLLACLCSCLFATACSNGGSSPVHDGFTPPPPPPVHDLGPVGCLAHSGACDDGDLCTDDVCRPDGSCGHTPAAGPCAWSGAFQPWSANPLLAPTVTSPMQGSDNVYAPTVLSISGTYWMYYGGQGSDGHDRIYLARTANLAWWEKFPSWYDPVPVVDRGTSNHVNDPSVVVVGGTFYMYYTDAATGEDDRINMAFSDQGILFTKKGRVLDVGPSGAWDAGKVGRPSVLYEQGEYRMWYDGQTPTGGRHVGYATSPDGLVWTRSPNNPIIMNAGAVDVQHLGSWYVLLTEGQDGTHLYVAKEPTKWQDRGLLLAKSGQPYDAFGHVTPHLVHDGETPIALLYGGASSSCWCKNRIAAAFYNASPKSCNACLGGPPSCQASCEGNQAASGVCGHPGSTDGSQCCTCTDDPCRSCLGSTPNCQKACKYIGATTGYCGFPGSLNPGACCLCY